MKSREHTWCHASLTSACVGVRVGDEKDFLFQTLTESQRDLIWDSVLLQVAAHLHSCSLTAHITLWIAKTLMITKTYNVLWLYNHMFKPPKQAQDIRAVCLLSPAYPWAKHLSWINLSVCGWEEEGLQSEMVWFPRENFSQCCFSYITENLWRQSACKHNLCTTSHLLLLPWQHPGSPWLGLISPRLHAHCAWLVMYVNLGIDGFWLSGLRSWDFMKTRPCMFIVLMLFADCDFSWGADVFCFMAASPSSDKL